MYCGDAFTTTSLTEGLILAEAADLPAFALVLPRPLFFFFFEIAIDVLYET
jgi:hypothetical protein